LFPLIAKIGRQELSYGDERLIGASDWTNVRRTFDAAKLRYEVEGFWVDAFVSHPVILWNDHFNESDGQDWFSGIYASTTKLVPWQESEFYFLARNTGTGSPQFYGPPPDPQGATPRDIYTVGVHFKSLPGKLGGWDYNLEAAGQFGRYKETAPRVARFGCRLSPGPARSHARFVLHQPCRSARRTRTDRWDGLRNKSESEQLRGLGD